jgi:hypothetical protein
VQRKDLNGVTFVVISNESNEEQFENLWEKFKVLFCRH